MVATNRQRAEQKKMTTEEYFYYSPRNRGRYYSWIKASAFNFPLSQVMCSECSYIPTTTCIDPKRAFREHVKKHHRATFFRDMAKPFVISEEPDVESVDVDAFLRELTRA